MSSERNIPARVVEEIESLQQNIESRARARRTDDDAQSLEERVAELEIELEVASKTATAALMAAFSLLLKDSDEAFVDEFFSGVTAEMERD